MSDWKSMTPEEKARLVFGLKDRGLSHSVIAARLGVGKGAIAGIVARHGRGGVKLIESRNPKPQPDRVFTDSENVALANAWSRAEGAKDIAARFGVTPGSISSRIVRLRSAGVVTKEMDAARKDLIGRRYKCDLRVEVRRPTRLENEIEGKLAVKQNAALIAARENTDVAPDSQPVSIIDADDCQCRWPLWRAGEPVGMVCGAVRRGGGGIGGMYCETHAAIACVPCNDGGDDDDF